MAGDNDGAGAVTISINSTILYGLLAGVFGVGYFGVSNSGGSDDSGSALAVCSAALANVVPSLAEAVGDLDERDSRIREYVDAKTSERYKSSDAIRDQARQAEVDSIQDRREADFERRLRNLEGRGSVGG